MLYRIRAMDQRDVSKSGVRIQNYKELEVGGGTDIFRVHLHVFSFISVIRKHLL